MRGFHLAIVLAVISTCPGPAQAQAPTVTGVIENGRMLVPLRGVFEQAGVAMAWYAPTRTVTMQHNARTVVLQVDYPMGWIDGQAVELDGPARLVSGRVYVPLRFAAEALGVEVSYARGVAQLRQSGRVIVKVRAAPGG